MKFRGEKVTFLGWLDNVWYHFKPHIIIGFFALVIVVVCSVQFFTREEHDVFVYVVGEYNLAPADANAFMTEMADSFTPDKNGDGKRVVDMKQEKFEMVETANGKKVVFNPSKQLQETESFNLELAHGECVIYIMQREFFEGNLDYIEPFSDTLGYVPNKALHGKGLLLSDLKGYKATMTLSYFPEDYVICLADKETRYDREYYDGQVEFLKNLIEWNVNKQ